MRKMLSQKPLLLTPGPVSASSALRNKLAEPFLHHRSLSFIQIFKETRLLLKKVFQTQQDVLILNASGTGAMASALLNTLSPGDTVLALSAGKFGERWVEMAKAYNLKVQIVQAPYGQAISPAQVKATLSRNKQIRAVLSQAVESSTGVLHPIEELAGLIKKRANTLFIVDAISAIGAVDIPMDKWGIDVVIGGSQKFFCLPAGLSFIALSSKAWQFQKKACLPVYYLDLKREKTAQAKGQTAFSANVSSICALHLFLTPLKKTGGLQKKREHIENLSKITRQFCQSAGLRLFASPSSPSLTCLALPQHIDGVRLKKQMEEKHGITLGGGQGKLKGRVIRVGHLGDISVADLKRSLRYLLIEIESFKK